MLMSGGTEASVDGLTTLVLLGRVGGMGFRSRPYSPILLCLHSLF